MLTQEEIQQKIGPILKQEGKRYKKYKRIFARLAQDGEKIVTITSDGVETVNYANEGDFIIRNQTLAGERYILSAEKFTARYSSVENGITEEGFKEYIPTGKIIAIQMTTERMNTLGFQDKAYFIASWGQKMVVKANDFLVSPINSQEVYRIAQKEFFETYLEDD